MKQINSDLERDMHYGQKAMFTSTPDDDAKSNIDCWIGNLPIAWRSRRLNLTRYNEISVRSGRASGAETEITKILNGKCRAKLYIFEFLDCYIVAKVDDIGECLRENKFTTKLNHDGITSAAYINIKDLPHLQINK